MNTLLELNNGLETIEFTDQRNPNVIFDRTIGTNQTVTANEGTSHILPMGIEILEIINYQSSAPLYIIDVSSLNGTTVSWTSLPSGLIVSNPSPGIYQVSGMKTVEHWQAIRNPTITPPSNYFGIFTYTAKVQYNTVSSKSWNITATIIDIKLFTLPENKVYPTGATNFAVMGPTVVDPGNPGATYTITVVPDKPDILSGATIGGTGGTATYNATTKTITITGTITQVNSRLANISISTTSTYSWNWYFIYNIISSLSEIDTVYQYFTNTDITYLGLTRSNESYSLNATQTISNGPQITDLTNQGIYNLEIKPYNSASVGSFSLSNTSVYEYQTNFFTSDYLNEKIYQYDPNKSPILDISDDALWAVSCYRVNDGTTDNITNRAYFSKRNSQNQYIQSSVKTTPISGYGFAIRAFISADATTAIITGAGPYFDIFYYKRSGDTWTYTSNPIHFGASLVRTPTDVDVSKDGQTIALGLGDDDTNGNNTGSVRIYKRSTDASWPLEATITRPGGHIPGSRFGSRVALSKDGNTLLISDFENNATNGTNVWVYTRSGTTWTLHTTIAKNNQISTSRWGETIKINQNGTVLAFSDYNGLTLTKNVYVYKLNNNIWSLSKTYTVSANVSPQPVYFATSINLSADGTFLTYDINDAVLVRNTITDTLQTLNLNTNLYYAPQSISMNNVGDFFALIARTATPGIDSSAILCYGTAEISINNTTKTINIRGSRTQINPLLDIISMTSATNYTQNFDLLYKVVTPNDSTQSRNQSVIYIP